MKSSKEVKLKSVLCADKLPMYAKTFIYANLYIQRCNEAFMETQELKMLNFLHSIETKEIETSEFFKYVINEFKSTDLAEILIMRLFNKGYIYLFVKDDKFVLGNAKVILTDKGNKYLQSISIVRWFIENGSITVTWGNIIALITFSVSIILNVYFHFIK